MLIKLKDPYTYTLNDVKWQGILELNKMIIFRQLDGCLEFI